MADSCPVRVATGRQLVSDGERAAPVPPAPARTGGWSSRSRSSARRPARPCVPPRGRSGRAPPRASGSARRCRARPSASGWRRRRRSACSAPLCRQIVEIAPHRLGGHVERLGERRDAHGAVVPEQRERSARAVPAGSAAASLRAMEDEPVLGRPQPGEMPGVVGEVEERVPVAQESRVAHGGGVEVRRRDRCPPAWSDRPRAS